jgi:antirestriction protein
MTTTTTTAARIYVGTYAKYNAGSIAGQWLELEDYADAEAFFAACAELHADESDAEFMFQDWEGLPRGMVGESHLAAEVWAWLEMDADERELLATYREAVDAGAELERAQEAYQGNHYDNVQDFAAQLWEDCGMLDNVPEHCRNYIDWEAVARDLLIGDYTSHRDQTGRLWIFRADL